MKSSLRLKTKKEIDHFVGSPLLGILDLFALFLGFVLKRDHRVLSPRVILIMKFQGMGSLVLAQPAIRRLKEKLPGVRFVFLGSSSTSMVASQMKEFDQVLVLEDSQILAGVTSLIRNLAILWKLKVDWVFDLEVYSKISSIIATLTCATNRAGFAIDSVKLRKYAHTHLVLFNRYEYLGTAYDRLLGLACLHLRSSELSTKTPAFEPIAWKFPLTSPPVLSGRKVIVVNVHAGELLFERKWPIESFSELIQQLLNRNSSHHVVLIGYGPEESAECKKIRTHERLIDLSGQLNFQETLSVMSHAELVISNDTAPLHLALSTSVPVLGLFGPTRPQSYFPSNRPKSIALTTNLYCSPCAHHWEPSPCFGNNQCLKTLSISTVLEAAEKLLQSNPEESRELKTNASVQLLNESQENSFYPGLVYGRGGHYLGAPTIE